MKTLYPLSDKNAFISLIDVMGNDDAIVQAARVSYGKDGRTNDELIKHLNKNTSGKYLQYRIEDGKVYALSPYGGWTKIDGEYGSLREELLELYNQQQDKDRQLIRYLMNHSHTTPFEMVEFKFMVQVPMDCWRQWIRHRTANVNEYSTRYTEALDFFQVTKPEEWRLQATDNKQGSSGYLQEHSDEPKAFLLTGEGLSKCEEEFHKDAEFLYKERLKLGIAKEQARKDLPLSTYTRAYWKCDLHNIFNFLRLRMDSHAQYEIRMYANSMFELVKEVCPVACEAFEDYVLHAKKFSRMEMELMREFVKSPLKYITSLSKPSSMTTREWKEFLEKLQ